MRLYDYIYMFFFCVFFLAKKTGVDIFFQLKMAMLFAFAHFKALQLCDWEKETLENRIQCNTLRRALLYRKKFTDAIGIQQKQSLASEGQIL